MLKHRKIALFTATAIASLFAVGMKANSVNAEDINVYTNSSVRDVTHVASGGLYAMSDSNTPNVSLLQPLKPKTFTQAPPFGQQIPNGEPKTAGDFDSIQPTAHQLGAKVIVRLPDFYPKFPYNFDNLVSWKANVTKMVKQAEKNSNDIYAYEIWNEPGTYWSGPSQKGRGAYANVTYDQLWNETWHIIKGINPNAKIVGPSLNGWNEGWMKGFLQNAKDNKTMPDYISWHQWSAASYPGQVKNLQGIEDSMGLKHLPISINEYAWRHELAVPGDSVHYIQNFENTTDTDSADLAFWYDYGRMDNLLTDQQKPNGGYWLYKWYGDMTGHIDSTSTYSENGNLASVASTNQDGSETNVIFGGTDGDNSIVVNGLESGKYANGAKIQVNETPWYGVDTAVQPKTIASGNLQVKNGSVTVPVKDMKASTGYQVLVTPAASPVTNDNLQYVQPTVNDPIRVEAEDGQITDGTKADGSYASNGHFVTDLNSNSSSVDMTVNALSDGDYNVEIGYGNGAGSNGVFNVSLNGSKQKDATFAPTGGWIGDTIDVNGNRKVTQYGMVHLNKGTNHFVLTHTSGYGQLDYAQFTLANGGSNTPGGGSSSSSAITSSSSSSSSAVTSSTSTSSSSSATTTSSSSVAPTKPSTSTSGSTSVEVPSSAAKKGSVIYALKKVNLYRTPTFKTTNKVATYVKRTRVNRPTFVVTGYGRSANGALRYRVRATNGKTGYLTAKASYVQTVYYQSLPKSRVITVIGKKGVNAYRTAKLTKQVKHYKNRTQLRVKKIVRHQSMTRYQLTNGDYVTGNKQLVIQGRY